MFNTTSRYDTVDDSNNTKIVIAIKSKFVFCMKCDDCCLHVEKVSRDRTEKRKELKMIFVGQLNFKLFKRFCTCAVTGYYELVHFEVKNCAKEYTAMYII